MSAPASPALHRLSERIAELEGLDDSAARLSEAVRGVLGQGALKDLLSGTPLGHALHPLLTDLPIGAWTSATLLDLIGGRESRRAAELLVAVGVATSLPTAVSGFSDWADTTLTSDGVRRIGMVHAAANTAALALYGGSLLARRRGRHGGARLLGLVGAGALAAGGHLGGHLSYARGVGVDQTAFEYRPGEWAAALREDELADGESEAVTVEGVEVMLARHGGELFALAERCTHRGGPLHEGELRDGCVRCPWHDSAFRLADGSIAAGPATAPQPAYEVRVQDGTIEVRAM